MAKVHHKTPDEDRVPVRQKIGYGFGAMSQVLGSYSIGNLASFVLNIGLGVNPVLVGLAQTIPRLWDAISDPVMGHISDNTRSRFGRRRPYMFFGAILTGVLFALLWAMPSGWSEKGYFAYFLGMSLLYYTALTVFMVPWGAMGLEMTPDYHERTRIQAVGNFFGNAGAILMPWLFALTQLDVFEDGLQGARYVGLLMGVVLVVSGLVPVFLCKEGHVEAALHQEKIGFWKGLKTTLGNRTFLLLMAVVFLVSTGFFIIASVSPYIIIYYVMGGDVKAASVYAGLNGTAWVVSSMLIVVPVTWSATHFGKKSTFLFFLFINLLGHVSKIWCYNPLHPLLVMVPPALIAAGFVAMWTIGASMIADICDVDELDTGARREGSYQAIFGWIMKTGMSVATLIGGVLLVASGFDATNGSAQSSETILWLRILEAGIPILTSVIAIGLIALYPLSEDRMYEIRAELKRRADGRQKD
ncbi:MAG: MFS transporter [Kiritimatiellales bacterium]|nr:MFS transporter [Kiritimatiellales bacterium]